MHRIALALALVITTAIAGSLSPGVAAQPDEGLTLTVAASNCPDITDYDPRPDDDLSTCLAGEGIRITASTLTGADFGECVTAGSVETLDAGSYAPCQIAVPDGLADDTELIALLHYEGVPDGYDASFASGSITVAALREAPDTVLRFYNPATPPPGPTGPPGYPITTFVCDSDPGPWSPFSARDIGGGCVRTGGISVTASLEDGTVLETCVTNDRGTCYLVEIPGGPDLTLIFTEDESTLPEGYVPRENPVTGTNYSEFKGSYFVNLPAGAPTTPTPSVVPSAPSTASAGTDGSVAAIYLGDCDQGTFDDPIAELTNVRPPEGEPQGADDPSAVETSFTTLDQPLDDILADDHVLVVFDEDDDTVALACGAIGGIVTDDGAVTFGLQAIGESRFSGVAYLSEDGDQTEATVFLAEDLSAEATPSI